MVERRSSMGGTGTSPGHWSARTLASPGASCPKLSMSFVGHGG